MTVKTFTLSGIEPFIIPSQSSTDTKELGSRLSEGITYIKEYNRIYWVDIFLGEIYSCNGNTQGGSVPDGLLKIKLTKSNYKSAGNTTIPYPGAEISYDERCGVVFPTTINPNTVLFGGKHGVGVADLSANTWHYKLLYRDHVKGAGKDWANLRSNDGNVNPISGDIYIGVMKDFQSDDKFLEQGCVLKIDKSFTNAKIVVDNIKIPNSINWYKQDDSWKVLLTDSLGFRILQFKVDSKTGDFVTASSTTDNKETYPVKFIDIIKSNNEKFASPEPDGSVVYKNKYFITAVWSSNKIQIYQIDTSANSSERLKFEYILPDTRLISCCCLGPKYNELLVTTASEDIPNKMYKGGWIYKIDLLKDNPSLFCREKDDTFAESSKILFRLL
ncbi:regucalcin SCDLUD_003600 [Saccharomycodes ludwigii]|uniref:regucalcin n=1 Tax=Saccharomycodes ludwigii TaxID=36035 RepID=UPI001E893721|nr:hypothetical protein SCDLUD_003600 [Saccharomycodes ludwigii]KAH3900608.1 hypothetical protein SCDLUD_003600 [Saccharomycodes ludwigii]